MPRRIQIQRYYDQTGTVYSRVVLTELNIEICMHSIKKKGTKGRFNTDMHHGSLGSEITVRHKGVSIIQPA